MATTSNLDERGRSLLRLAQSLTESSTRDQIAQRLAEALPPLSGATRAIVYLWDEATDALKPHGVSGYPEEVGRVLLQMVFHPSDGPLFSQVTGNGEPQHFEADTVEDPLIRERMKTFGAAEAVGIPIVSRDRTLGIMAVSREPQDPPLAVGEAFYETLTAVAHLAGTAFDNARLLEAERTTTETLRETNRFRNEFLGVISHELRTPLAAILGMARTLLGRGTELSDEVRRDFLASIVERGEQLERLVEDLLQSSRELELRPDAVDLAHLLLGAADQARQISREATILCEIPERLPAYMDGGRIRQVVDNLITNAVRYGGGTVTVSAARQGNEIVLEVCDDGPGMEPAQIERAFDAFYQANENRAGVGLGLYISRRIVESHGGSIHIRSSPDNGTSVSVRLPSSGPPGLLRVTQ